MSGQSKPKRTLLDRVGDVVLFVLLLSAFLEGWGRSPISPAVVKVVQFVCVGFVFAYMMWQLGRRTELERLIFYQASAVAFAASVAIGLGYGILEELNVVEPTSGSNFAILAGVAFFAAMLFLRWRKS